MMLSKKGKKIRKAQKLTNRNWIELTLRTSIVNWVRLQCMQTFASLSGTQTAAWCSTGFLPPTKIAMDPFVNKYSDFFFFEKNSFRTYSFSIDLLCIYLCEPSILVFLYLLLHTQQTILSLCEWAIHFDILDFKNKKKTKHQNNCPRQETKQKRKLQNLFHWLTAIIF